MEDGFDIDKLCQMLISNQKFISAVGCKLSQRVSQARNEQNIDSIIEQLQTVIQNLIQRKLYIQMSNLMEDNNRILEQIKFNLDRKQNRVVTASSSIIDTSFTEIHNMINEEKKKAFQRFSDAELEKSISLMDRYEDVIDKVQQIQKKVKGLQDKYETNFRSLWNVLSMTQAAVFDHIKQNKQLRQPKVNQNKQPIPGTNSSFLMSFWK